MCQILSKSSIEDFYQNLLQKMMTVSRQSWTCLQGPANGNWCQEDKVMVFSKKGDDAQCEMRINKVLLEQVVLYRHLGSLITKDGKSVMEIRTRTAMLNKKLSYHRDSAHLTSLYRTEQKAFRYVEPFKGMCISYRQCWNKVLTKVNLAMQTHFNRWINND